MPKVILVVDDDAQFNRAFLRVCGEETVVAAESIDDGIALAEALGPDHIFLDVRFDGPWRTGIDAIPDFMAAAPGASLIMMSSIPNDYDRQRAIDAGAAGYCMKTDLVRVTGVAVALRAARAISRRARPSSRAVALRPPAPAKHKLR